MSSYGKVCWKFNKRIIKNLVYVYIPQKNSHFPVTIFFTLLIHIQYIFLLYTVPTKGLSNYNFFR